MCSNLRKVSNTYLQKLFPLKKFHECSSLFKWFLCNISKFISGSFKIGTETRNIFLFYSIKHSRSWIKINFAKVKYALLWKLTPPPLWKPKENMLIPCYFSECKKIFLHFKKSLKSIFCFGLQANGQFIIAIWGFTY